MPRDIWTEYFDWMYNLVCYNETTSYRRLLLKLHDIPFTYMIQRDKNRATDGVSLRFHFCDENDIPLEVLNHVLGNKPCSVLEMMVALARRIEESIMADPGIGNRTGLWFFEMLSSLHLILMDDSAYDEKEVERAINLLLSRGYSYNGDGGLFTLRRPLFDMRRMEIWYQMNGYLNEYSGYD